MLDQLARSTHGSPGAWQQRQNVGALGRPTRFVLTCGLREGKEGSSKLVAQINFRRVELEELRGYGDAVTEDSALEFVTDGGHLTDHDGVEEPGAEYIATLVVMVYRHHGISIPQQRRHAHHDALHDRILCQRTGRDRKQAV